MKIDNSKPIKSDWLCTKCNINFTSLYGKCPKCGAGK